MKYSYIFFKTDASFDYLSPLGPATYHCEDLHGFDFDFETLDLKSLEGYGEFSDVEKCKNLEELLDYIKDNIRYLMPDYGASPQGVFDELIEILEEKLRTKCA